MNCISNLTGRFIFDSRGIPTVEAEVTLNNGLSAIASVPSGASTGSKEAVELRDKDTSLYNGKSVFKAVENINTKIFESLVGLNPLDQNEIDRLLIDLDGTKNKGNLGANAILAVSMAVCRVSANSLSLPLYRYISGKNNISMPIPLINVINGGAHANNNLDIQEFMLVPHNFSTFSDAIHASNCCFHELKKIISSQNYSTAVGDEGGFAPNLKDNKEAIELLLKCIENTGYKPGDQISIALDCAASEFYKDGVYTLKSENSKLTNIELVDYLDSLCSLYPIISIEDPLDENDFVGWSEITKKLSNKIKIVGDDLFVTNYEILKDGIEKNVANSILIKPNQIGTISETINTINLAKENKYSTIVSHRSGETEDNFIADLSVGTNSGFIKTGSMSRSDRMSKYNQLLRIESENKKFINFG